MANDLYHGDIDIAAAPAAAGQSIAVIVNGGAGTGHDRELAGRVCALFAGHGLVAEVAVAHDGSGITAATQAAVAQGARTVVAGGGDGTINAVASVIVGSGIALGILPLGTLNHFAKDLGIPLALEDAVALIARGRTRLVDVGEVNCRIFLNNSSLGLYPAIVRKREKQQRLGRGKWPAALWATVSALRRYPFLKVQLRIDGREVPRRTPFVFVGNNQYTMQGLSVGARTSLDQGQLCLYVAQNPGRLALLGFALRALVGRLAQARDFDVALVQKLEIETHHTHLRVATDGEVSMLRTPLSYRVLPRALTVIAPD
ncbi:diacylglycerol/lipid kinase family protein [Pseudoduganella sp. GCM10020061]|uniref:diacylglycerol/lipid kinase family protein n=1 Tax=Pseudoduganella sp. GCM10020061 TaxID=3317345 RepID=UPI0036359D1C